MQNPVVVLAFGSETPVYEVMMVLRHAPSDARIVGVQSADFGRDLQIAVASALFPQNAVGMPAPRVRIERDEMGIVSFTWPSQVPAPEGTQRALQRLTDEAFDYRAYVVAKYGEGDGREE